MPRGSRWLARLCFVLMAAAALSKAGAEPIDPSLYSDLRWRLVGPFRGGWATCAAGVPEDPDVYYFGGAAGRRVEDRRRRGDLDSDLRPRRIRLGRRPRRGAVEPESHLGRHRADPGSVRRRVGRRRLPLRRRRGELAQRRPRRDARDRAHLGRPARSERGRRRRARPHVREQSRARDLPDRGRREDVVARPLRRRPDRRRRSGRRSRERLGALRLAVAGAELSLAVVFRADGRAGQRDLQVRRRRPDLEEARRRGMADGRSRADRPGREPAWTRLRPRRRRVGGTTRPLGGRALSLGRRRRDMGARQRNAGTRLVLHRTG